MDENIIPNDSEDVKIGRYKIKRQDLVSKFNFFI
jgi:hypothetical protein